MILTPFVLSIMLVAMSIRDVSDPKQANNRPVQCPQTGNGELGPHRIVTEELEIRGKQLRTDIENIYDELEENRSLKSGIPGNDITEVSLRYLSKGMSFRDAETILCYAGFSIGEHPGLESPKSRFNPEYWYAVVSRISPLRSGFLWGADVYITLYPESPTDYTIVTKITAKIHISTP